jgi:hypothetical protein
MEHSLPKAGYFLNIKKLIDVTVLFCYSYEPEILPLLEENVLPIPARTTSRVVSAMTVEFS